MAKKSLFYFLFIFVQDLIVKSCHWLLCILKAEMLSSQLFEYYFRITSDAAPKTPASFPKVANLIFVVSFMLGKAVTLKYVST